MSDIDKEPSEPIDPVEPIEPKEPSDVDPDLEDEDIDSEEE